MAWVRVSPGVYRDSKTGKTVKSATKPKDQPAAKPAAKKAASKPNVIKNTNIDKVTSGTKPVNQALNTGLEAGQAAATASNLTANANTKNPFGASTTTVDPVTGQATVTQSLSGGQQKILDQGEALTQGGQAWAQKQMGNFQQFNPDLSAEGRQKAADAAFAQLSRGMDTRQKQQIADLEQSLYNRGIQFSNDPNSRYQQELQSMQQSQQDERNNIANQAYNVGLGEQQAQFGMGQQTNQTQLGNMQAMQGMGTGLMVPNFQQFQGSAVDPSLGAGTQLGYDQLAQQKKVDAATIAKLKGSGSGGGSSSGGTASNPSPFG